MSMINDDDGMVTEKDLLCVCVCVCVCGGMFNLCCFLNGTWVFLTTAHHHRLMYTRGPKLNCESPEYGLVALNGILSIRHFIKL